MRHLLYIAALLFTLPAFSQPVNRIKLRQLQSAPDTSLQYFVSSQGDTAEWVLVSTIGGGGGSTDTLYFAGGSGTPFSRADGDTLTIAGAGIASTSASGSTITVTATEVDGSTTNELSTVSSITNVPDTTSLAPKAGDAFINTSADTLGLYSGTGWVLFYGGGGGASQTLSLTGDSLSISGGNTIDVRPDWYNVRDFGAIPDDGTDDTAEIQAAIDACFDGGGGTVFFPKGIYNIDDTLRTSVDGENPNSQLYIPKNDTDTLVMSVRLLGEQMPAMTSGAIADFAMPKTGVILLSSIAGSGTYPSVIAASPNVAGLFSVNLVTVIIENITVRVDANEGGTGPTMGGVNLADANQAILKGVRADIDVTIFTTSVEPQNEVFGIRMPKRNNGTISRFDNCKSKGFRYGFVISEHATGTNNEARANYYGLALEGAGHAIHLDRFLAQWNKHSLAHAPDNIPNSNVNSYITIDQFNIETASQGKWYDNVATNTIVDASNRIHGHINWHLSQGAGGPGVDYDALNVSGGANLFTRRVGVGATNVTATGTLYSSVGTDSVLYNNLEHLELQGIITNSVTQTAGYGPYGIGGAFPVSSLTASGTTTVNFQSRVGGYFQIDMGSTTEDSLIFSNPNGSVIPTYRLHWQSVTANADTVTFPANVLSYAGDTLASRELVSDSFLECYYDGSNYYCSDTLGASVTVPASAGGGQDSTIVTSTSGLIAWYNANRETEYADGNAIDTLHDWSGLGHHLAQTTGASQPTYQTGIVNGYPVAQFDGTNDYILRDSLGELASGNDFTIFAVAKSTDAEKFNMILCTLGPADGGGGGAANDRFGFNIDTRTTPNRLAYMEADNTIYLYDRLAESDTVFQTISIINDFVSSGGNLSGRVNGTSQGSATVWSFSSTSYNNLRLNIGSQDIGAPSYMTGYVAEIIIYNRVLTSGEIGDVESYLRSKYAHY